MRGKAVAVISTTFGESSNDGRSGIRTLSLELVCADTRKRDGETGAEYDERNAENHEKLRNLIAAYRKNPESVMQNEIDSVERKYDVEIESLENVDAEAFAKHVAGSPNTPKEIADEIQADPTGFLNARVATLRQYRKQEVEDIKSRGAAEIAEEKISALLDREPADSSIQQLRKQVLDKKDAEQKNAAGRNKTGPGSGKGA